MRPILVLLLTLLATIASAEAAKYRGTARSVERGPASKDPIVINVAAGGKIAGAIYSNVHGRRIPLQGQVRKDGTFRARVKKGDQVSGFITGKVRGGELSGRGFLQGKMGSDVRIKVSARVRKAGGKGLGDPLYMLEDLFHYFFGSDPYLYFSMSIKFTSDSVFDGVMRYTAQMEYHYEDDNPKRYNRISYIPGLAHTYVTVGVDDTTRITFPNEFGVMKEHVWAEPSRQWSQISVVVHPESRTKVDVYFSKQMAGIVNQHYEGFTGMDP